MTMVTATSTESPLVGKSKSGTAHSSQSRVAMALVVVVACLLAVRVLLPLWAPLLLAAWFADLLQPMTRKLTEWMRGRHRIASLTTVMLFMLALSPLVIVALSLGSEAVSLVQSLRRSDSVEAVFESLRGSAVATDGDMDWKSALTNEPQRILELARRGGTTAWGFARSVAGATMALTIAVVVFVMGFYVFLADGSRIGAWLERYSPLPKEHFSRFSDAFYETGRGLIVGVGLAALAQGALAGIGYLFAGLSHAFALAILTVVAALIPSLGSGLVWLPVAVVLALSDRVADAVVVLVLGGIAGLSDNFLRPWLSRFGRLTLPTFALFCAMLGGVTALGPAGILLGPLFLRLAMEALAIWRTQSEATRSSVQLS